MEHEKYNEFGVRRQLEALCELLPESDPAFMVMVSFVERRLIELSNGPRKNSTVRRTATRAA